MNPKDYQSVPQQKLSFEEWRADRAPQFNEQMVKSMERMHGIDYKKEYEQMLKQEYDEYVSNLNGNWLL